MHKKMYKKTKERIKFITDNPNMTRIEIQKALKISPEYLTLFAKRHGLGLKTNRDILNEFVIENCDLSAMEIVERVEKEKGRRYKVQYISLIARELSIILPHSRVKARENMGIFLKREPKVVIYEEEVVKQERPPAVYTNIKSDYTFNKL